jgi:hypothetical protein
MLNHLATGSLARLGGPYTRYHGATVATALLVMLTAPSGLPSRRHSPCLDHAAQEWHVGLLDPRVRMVPPNVLDGIRMVNGRKRVVIVRQDSRPMHEIIHDLRILAAAVRDPVAIRRSEGTNALYRNRNLVAIPEQCVFN